MKRRAFLRAALASTLAPSVMAVALESAARAPVLTASQAVANLDEWMVIMREIFNEFIWQHLNAQSELLKLLSSNAPSGTIEGQKLVFHTDMRYQNAPL